MTTPQTHTRTPPAAWGILCALGLIFALFAADRAVLGILKTTLAKEIGLTNKDYSLLVSAFMVPYTAMYLFVGGWIDRFGVKYMLTICLFGMSLAAVATGYSQNVGQMAASRFLLGLAEAGIVPAITLAIFTWFSSERRALAYTLANTVQQTAYILCPPFVANVTLIFGWRWSFLIPGLLGFGVVALWLAINKRAGAPPIDEAAAKAESRSAHDEMNLGARIRLLLSLPAVRVLILARIISDPFWFFFQYWQTPFLQEHVGMSLIRVGKLTWIPPLVYMGAAIIFSAASDKLVARGWPAARARVILLIGSTLLAPASFLLPQLIRGQEIQALVLTAIVWVMCATWLNMSSVFMGTLVPRHVLASAIGIMSALGGITSIGFNALAGTIIDRFGYSAPMYVGACLHPVAALLLTWFFFFRKSKPSDLTHSF